MAGNASTTAGDGGRPLLTRKLRVPELRRGTVARTRLGERLDAHPGSGLVLVSAPAGFGKTTLVRQWLGRLSEQEPQPAVAWVSLDKADDDSATFWTYVVGAIHRALDVPGPDAATLYQSARAGTDVALAQLLNELDEGSNDVVLVLDDYHVVTAEEIHEGVTYLLDHLPPHVRVVLTTRTDPPLPLARLRARGLLLEVRAADLRFTSAEAGSYLAGTMGLSLTDTDVSVLAERTEGWIAALQLAGLSLQQRDDASGFIANFAGDDRYVVDYLAEEVLQSQPPDVRDFLLRTSVLDRLTGDLCDAVTGGSTGSSMLVSLERANLFLTSLDDRREWYRYHQLFSDVLSAHLSEQSPDELPELHRRASLWFEERSAPTDAIAHAVAAGDLRRAAALMEAAMPMMRRDRREPELAMWVQSLPDDIVDVRPVLGAAFVGALAQISKFDSVDDRLTRIEDLLQNPDGSWPADPPAGVLVVDLEEYRAIPATVETYRAALALSRSDLAGTARHAQAALSMVPPDVSLIRAAAGALGGLAAWAAGDLDGALAAYAQSTDGLRRLGFLSDVLGCTITLGDLCRTQGRLSDALHTYEQALVTTTQVAGHEVRGAADMHVGIATVLLEQDDLAGAAHHLAASQQLGELMGLPQNPYRWRLASAALRTIEGGLDAALELLDEADAVYNGDYAPNVRPVPSVRARLRIRRGELSHAQDWARQHQISADDAPAYLHEHEHLTLARLLIAQHHQGDQRALDVALGLLDRLAADADAGGRSGSLIEILVLQALAKDASVDLDGAVEALHQAVGLARPHGWIRVFADEGPRVAALLKRADVPAPERGYARRLAAATSRAPLSVPADQGSLLEPLSDRELDVLRLLATDLDGPDIARQLHVSLNTLRTHTRNIFRKLAVNNRRAAVRLARELELLG